MFERLKNLFCRTKDHSDSTPEVTPAKQSENQSEVRVAEQPGKQPQAYDKIKCVPADRLCKIMADCPEHSEH